MTKFQRKHLRKQLILLHARGNLRFAELARDIVRYYLAPMLMYPYTIVSCDFTGELLLRRGLDAFIDRLRVEDGATEFARTRAGWIVLNNTINYIGLHGRYETSCSTNYPQLAVTGDDIRIVKIGSNFEFISFAYLGETPEANSGSERKDMPAQLHGMTDPRVVAFESGLTKGKIYVWDGARKIYQVLVFRGSVVAATRDLDAVPICVRGMYTPGEIMVTWSWGERDFLHFFALVESPGLRPDPITKYGN